MEKRNWLAIPIVIFLCVSFARAQKPNDWCGTDHQPSTIANSEIQRPKQGWVGSKLTASQAVKYIPIVVHIVYKNSTENLSDAQILSQINVVNEDFRRMAGTPGSNTHLDGIDTAIEFRLAEFDENSNSTNGITRTQTTVQKFFRNASDPTQEKVKFTNLGGKDAWDTDEYLNVWVCDIQDGLFGWAEFPGETTPTTDGVVIDFTAFGDDIGTALPPTDLGRTLTHEIGHWINLIHLWVGRCGETDCNTEGDKVCDTPRQDGQLTGCPQGSDTCGDGQEDQIENYMQLTDDSCMNLFTVGQRLRMGNAINQYRPNIENSPGLSSTDFILFGTHSESHSYNVSTAIITKSSSPYSAFTVSNSGDVTFRAGKSITLGPGFSAVANSQFRAYIDEALDISSMAPHFYSANMEPSPDELPSNGLLRNYPNPFNPSTNIHYSVSQSGFVELVIYDRLGRLVRRMVHSQHTPGDYSIAWNGTDKNGLRVASGVYFYFLKVGREPWVSQKMILLK